MIAPLLPHTPGHGPLNLVAAAAPGAQGLSSLGGSFLSLPPQLHSHLHSSSAVDVTLQQSNSEAALSMLQGNSSDPVTTGSYLPAREMEGVEGAGLRASMGKRRVNEGSMVMGDSEGMGDGQEGSDGGSPTVGGGEDWTLQFAWDGEGDNNG